MMIDQSNSIFGIPKDNKPILNLTEGDRAKLVFSQDDFAFVYLESNGVTTKHLLMDTGDYWEIGKQLQDL